MAGPFSATRGQAAPNSGLRRQRPKLCGQPQRTSVDLGGHFPDCSPGVGSNRSDQGNSTAQRASDCGVCSSAISQEQIGTLAAKECRAVFRPSEAPLFPAPQLRPFHVVFGRYRRETQRTERSEGPRVEVTESQISQAACVTKVVRKRPISALASRLGSTSNLDPAPIFILFSRNSQA